MQAYQDPEYDTSTDWAFALAFAQNQRLYAFPVQDLQPCKNVDCTNKSYALFCSEDCRVVVEGQDTEPDEDDSAFYHADAITLGHIATADAQHQADQAAGGFAALVCGVQPQTVTAPVQALPEAAASATVRLTIAGHTDVLFTIRDHSETRLLQRLETLLQRFPVQPPVAAQSTPVEPGEGWCSIHNTQMTFHKADNGGRDWWSHRQGVDFCKGIAKGGRQRRQEPQSF